jgi:hypothetical protein
VFSFITLLTLCSLQRNLDASSLTKDEMIGLLEKADAITAKSEAASEEVVQASEAVAAPAPATADSNDQEPASSGAATRARRTPSASAFVRTAVSLERWDWIARAAPTRRATSLEPSPKMASSSSSLHALTDRASTAGTTKSKREARFRRDIHSSG